MTRAQPRPRREWDPIVADGAIPDRCGRRPAQGIVSVCVALILRVARNDLLDSEWTWYHPVGEG